MRRVSLCIRLGVEIHLIARALLNEHSLYCGKETSGLLTLTKRRVAR